MTERFRPTTRRQRLTIIAVTLCTVLGLWWLLLAHPGGDYSLPDLPPPTACSPGQTTGCVGGVITVKVVTPAGAVPAGPASASASAAGR
jgi:hypothetical protein